MFQILKTFGTKVNNGQKTEKISEKETPKKTESPDPETKKMQILITKTALSLSILTVIASLVFALDSMNNDDRKDAAHLLSATMTVTTTFTTGVIAYYFRPNKDK